jgi:UDP-glucose 4-epimerase
MKIMMTGVTSFSGYWFARQVMMDGHELYCVRTPFASDHNSNQWIDMLKLEGFSFSIFKLDDNKADPMDIDLLLLHGSHMQGRKSVDFDISNAVENTVKTSVMIKEKFNTKYVVHTGTFSESNEGVGECPDKAFNPYSQSKSLIYAANCEIFSSIPILKYVMPNPFGEYQRNNLFSYLEACWKGNLIPNISNPGYIRDFVPVDLLAKNYATVVYKFATGEIDFKKYYPSYYVMSNKDMAELYAHKLSENSSTKYNISVSEQTLYDEPRIRINLSLATEFAKDWDSNSFWKKLTESFLRS